MGGPGTWGGGEHRVNSRGWGEKSLSQSSEPTRLRQGGWWGQPWTQGWWRGLGEQNYDFSPGPEEREREVHRAWSSDCMRKERVGAGRRRRSSEDGGCRGMVGAGSLSMIRKAHPCASLRLFLECFAPALLSA